MIRWPGVIKPGTIINDIGAHEDMIPTLLAAAGDTTVKEDLLKGQEVGDMTYKVHLDGYNLMPALKGEGQWPRQEFLYWTDDGSVAALRYDNWKVTFLRAKRSSACMFGSTRSRNCAGRCSAICAWTRSSARNTRGLDYGRWSVEHMFVLAPAGAYVGQWLQSFREFPPRMKPGSFSLDRVMEAVTTGGRQGDN